MHRLFQRAENALERGGTSGLQIDLVIEELNHRICSFLPLIEALVRQTQSTAIGDYKARLLCQLSDLRNFYEGIAACCGTHDLTTMLEQTMRPYFADETRVIVTGPDVKLEPKLALSLNLVFHELATNAKKYGALISPFGVVTIEWTTLDVAGTGRKLAIVWAEHGGPEVNAPQHEGFGLRLIKKALEGLGEVRLLFNRTGLNCLMLLELGIPSQQSGLVPST